MFYSRELGIELLGVDDYSRNWAGEGKNYMLENYHKQWDQVPCPMPNDLLLFNNSAGVTCHCGIYLGENKFIHCAKIAGVIISRIGEWKQPLQGVYRFKT
jgi:cell wall-associated NlpC family hydrolase